METLLPFDGVTAPQAIVGGWIRLLRVQRAQRGVKGFVIPHVKELPRPFAHVRLEVAHGRAERVLKLAQVAIEDDGPRGPRRDTTNAGGQLDRLRKCNARQARDRDEQDQVMHEPIASEAGHG